MQGLKQNIFLCVCVCVCVWEGDCEWVSVCVWEGDCEWVWLGHHDCVCVCHADLTPPFVAAPLQSLWADLLWEVLLQVLDNPQVWHREGGASVWALLRAAQQVSSHSGGRRRFSQSTHSIVTRSLILLLLSRSILTGLFWNRTWKHKTELFVRILWIFTPAWLLGMNERSAFFSLFSTEFFRFQECFWALWAFGLCFLFCFLWLRALLCACFLVGVCLLHLTACLQTFTRLVFPLLPPILSPQQPPLLPLSPS